MALSQSLFGLCYHVIEQERAEEEKRERERIEREKKLEAEIARDNATRLAELKKEVIFQQSIPNNHSDIPLDSQAIRWNVNGYRKKNRMLEKIVVSMVV
jgi:hypothetical protein